jgi:hypothetical protein
METTRPQPHSKVPFTSPGFSQDKCLWLYTYLLTTPQEIEWDPEIQEYLMTEEGSKKIEAIKKQLNAYRLHGHPYFPDNPPVLTLPLETLAAAKIALRIRIQTLWQRRNSHPEFKPSIHTEIRENTRALRHLRQTFIAFALPHFNETLRHWPLPKYEHNS